MTILKNKIGQFERMNDFSDIENDKYVSKWLDGIKSKSGRLSIMYNFCNFLGKTPTDLAIEHQEDLKKDVLERSNIAKIQLNSFFGYLTNTNDKKWKNTLNDKVISKPLAWNSARQYVFSKLLSFYSRLGIPLKYNKKEKPIEASKNVREKTWREDNNGERKLIKHEDKKECLKQIRDSFNSLRDKAIFLGKLSSALDDVDMFNLKIKDYREGFLPDYNICYLQGNRQKDGVLYQTFFGNEACNMIKLYLKDRLDKINKKGSEKLTEISKKEYLFVAKEKRMIERYFSEKMKEIVDKLDLINITPKSLRRWFNTHLEKNSVKTSIIRRLMGHKGDIGDEHYNMIFEQAKESEYEELALFFSEKIDTLVSLGNGNRKLTQVGKKMEKLENQNKDLIEQLAETNKKVERMEEIIEKVPNLLGLYNTVSELLSMPENKRFFEFITDLDNDKLDVLSDLISKAPNNKESFPKEKDKEIKGFNLKSK